MDDTAERIRAWEQRDSRIRYIRVEPNRGTPGVTRNVGTEQAIGEWVAYLDDDDAWLPRKLERQLDASSEFDIVGTNALRPDGSPYFAIGSSIRRLARADLIVDNPLLMSSVMARRDVVLRAGGFITDRWARGVADYGMWLTLSDHAARFGVLPEPLVLYESESDDRMSARPVRQELAVARLAWRRVRAHPRDRPTQRAALNRSASVITTAARSLRLAR
jgi:glycosyltransferase involved in cell wall biosynthesis